MTIINIIITLAGLIAGFFFGRRLAGRSVDTGREPSPPKYEDRIHDILTESKSEVADFGTDDDLARWLDEHVGRGK